MISRTVMAGGVGEARGYPGRAYAVPPPLPERYAGPLVHAQQQQRADGEERDDHRATPARCVPNAWVRMPSRSGPMNAVSLPGEGEEAVELRLLVVRAPSARAGSGSPTGSARQPARSARPPPTAPPGASDGASTATSVAMLSSASEMRMVGLPPILSSTKPKANAPSPAATFQRDAEEQDLFEGEAERAGGVDPAEGEDRHEAVVVDEPGR